MAKKPIFKDHPARAFFSQGTPENTNRTPLEHSPPTLKPDRQGLEETLEMRNPEDGDEEVLTTSPSHFRRFGGLRKPGPSDLTKKKSFIIRTSQEAHLWMICEMLSREAERDVGLMSTVRDIFEDFISRPENQKRIKQLKKEDPVAYAHYCRKSGWRDDLS